MTQYEMQNEYFEWMIGQVCDSDHPWNQLLGYLSDIDFRCAMPMDENRASDGESLRYEFGYERDYDHRMIAAYLDNRPCSVLEMMVALSKRCEEQIMFDPKCGSRTKFWFRSMLKNMGLADMTDDGYFERGTVLRIVDRFMDRRYDPDGRGGLFYIPSTRRDLREVEIWCQMCWYLNLTN